MFVFTGSKYYVNIMKNKHPFAVNSLLLQEYDFNKTKNDEVLFFEWLVIKRISFRRETFFYQQRRVFDEVGIKRARLETIKSKFIDYGLVIENEGFSNTCHYTVSLEFISNFINIGVKKQFQKQKLACIATMDFNKEKPLSQTVRKKTELLISRLNSVFNERRELYSDKNTEIQYTYSSLAINEKSYKQLSRLKSIYDNETIENGFTAYCDDVIQFKDRVSSSHMVNHFSSYDLSAQKFPLFERYLHFYNQNYSIKK